MYWLNMRRFEWMTVAWTLTLLLMAQDAPLDRARLASQAQSFAEQLRNLISEETLRQKSFRYSSRMRIRFGENALKPIEPKIQTREIHSEFGFALRGKESPVWAELRKVKDVDGRVVMAPKQARERLISGITSDDDRSRVRMMEEFTRYGLEDLATDYSLSLLMFRVGEVDKFQFEPVGTEFAGADRVNVYRFSRSDDAVAVTLIDRRQAVRRPLAGRIWLRADTGVPMRIELIAEQSEGKARLVDEGVIEYVPTKFGTVAPRTVKHSRRLNGVVLVETTFDYKEFQKFGADAELKFTP